MKTNQISKIAYKLVLVAVLLIQTSSFLYAKTKTGFGIIKGFSPDEVYLATLLRQHLSNIAASLGIFDVVNPDSFIAQMQRLTCNDEQCLLAFSKNAGLSIFITGVVQREADGYRISVKAFGMDAPYYGRQICHYTASVKVNIFDKADREASYIAEEIAAECLVMLCREFKYPVAIVDSVIDSEFQVSGTFTYYKEHTVYDGYTTLKPEGIVTIQKNKTITPLDGYVLLLDFKNEALYLQNFYYGRKQEIVFKKSRLEDSCTIMAFTVPASATMPLVVPLFGYYANEDYTGLFLWAGNVVPYIGLQLWGLTHTPQELQTHRDSISRHDKALYFFGWYMLLVGGMPSFVDAFAQEYLKQARYYQGQVPTMGDMTTLVYLSVLGGGSGMFYKGHRFFGYLYFHLTNLCMYGIFYNYAQPMQWDAAYNRYSGGKRNMKNVYIFSGLLSLIKIIEIAHTVSVPYAISVTDTSNSIIFLPVLAQHNDETVIGVTCAMQL